MNSESLVAQFRVLFIRLWHSNHLRHGHSVDLAESLREADVSRCMSRRELNLIISLAAAPTCHTQVFQVKDQPQNNHPS